MEEIAERQEADDVADEPERVVEFVSLGDVEIALAHRRAEADGQRRAAERQHRDEEIGDDEGLEVDVQPDFGGNLGDVDTNPEDDRTEEREREESSKRGPGVGAVDGRFGCRHRRRALGECLPHW
ncbi:hypothetical protein VB779_07730 [Haloarculaceae archaeon H-GB11]|nr:hypothetical protein [Haloarculaceae archaeon H-GB11]